MNGNSDRSIGCSAADARCVAAVGMLFLRILRVFVVNLVRAALSLQANCRRLLNLCRVISASRCLLFEYSPHRRHALVGNDILRRLRIEGFFRQPPSQPFFDRINQDNDQQSPEPCRNHPQVKMTVLHGLPPRFRYTHAPGLPTIILGTRREALPRNLFRIFHPNPIPLRDSTTPLHAIGMPTDRQSSN